MFNIDKNMNVIIFGGSGRTGLYLVNMALEQGYNVTVFLRNTQGFSITHPNLQLIQGDVLDLRIVSMAVKGQDAVISAIGEGIDAATKVRSRGSRNIVASMLHHQLNRIIAIAGTGVLNADASGNLIMNSPSFPEMYRLVAEEQFLVYDTLKNSGLQWTLYCPPYIPDGDPSGSFITSEDFAPENMQSITTGDLALSIIDTLKNNSFIGKRVGITNLSV